jgi:SNF2 family DNA or RNA helicase
MNPGRLHNHSWKRFLRGPDPTLLEELYVPALGEAIRYNRCCSYFSSSVLAAAARGFGRLIERLEILGEKAPRPAIRLVVNEELVEEDVRAMIETGDLSKLEEQLKRRFKSPKEFLEKQRLGMLGWLIKKGLLEVRVGLMRRGGGIVHAKFGIALDESGEAIVFSGSGNETAQGLIGNYERLEISTSWDDPERYQEYNKEFDLLWKDAHPDVYTVSLPEALRLRLIKFAPPEPPILEPSTALIRQKAAMIWNFIVEAPFLPDGGPACDATAMVDLWPHQRRVVEETTKAWPEGRLLCDEVGMGKTIEAILILRRLMAGRGVRRALILLPAGLLKQWQDELREKGGMIFPRLEGITNLVWPDDRIEKVNSLTEALEQDVLLVSREMARTENNLPVILAAKPWDLVILDESHAARRRKQEEGEFNSGTLLLNLLRQLQLQRRTRGFLLLSATPMQTHPWEPWDLLATLGEGGAWLAGFPKVRDFYTAIEAVRQGRCDMETARKAALMIAADPRFPLLDPEKATQSSFETIAQKLTFVPPTKREVVAQWLRQGSPLSRRMHRNTRKTLRSYYEMGLLPEIPPNRKVEDYIYDFEDPAERRVYDSIRHYIENRFQELEREKPGKGFVMTVYRRRATSSPLALERSLKRRREGLQRVAERKAYEFDLSSQDVPEAIEPDDLPEGEISPKISAALPQDPKTARNEIIELDQILERLRDLRGQDTKRDRFFDILRKITDDGRPVLIFTEYTDTLEYLRDSLLDHYGKGLGCYSGEGGQRRVEGLWKMVSKAVITEALKQGELQVLLCTDAASEGLNLQAAGAIINYDLPWNPSKVEQRIGRIDRIGQKFPEVRVVNLFLKDSVDDRVYSALRDRCGLFEHFVGAMQPVLARARRMLLGQDPVDSKILETFSNQIEQDALSKETYLESPAEGGWQGQNPLSRSQIEDALSILNGEFGPKAKKLSGSSTYKFSGPGMSQISFTTRMEDLERDRAVLPLSPFDDRIKELSSRLFRPGERLPLVVGTHQKEAFRCSVVYLVEKEKAIPVKTFENLRKLLEDWDGFFPNLETWLAAERTARKEAKKWVDDWANLATKKEQEGLQRQIESARIRLQKELGRYLVCLDFGAGNLNELFHQQMTRDIASSGRLKQAFEKLGGYPEWPSELLRNLETFASQLTENQRKARLLGKELDAALEDPRWMATIS